MKNILLAFLLFSSIASCTKQSVLEPETNLEISSDTSIDESGRRGIARAGVVLTFDDAWVDQWTELNKTIARKYDWKATFYVSNFTSLDNEKIRKLKVLQYYGHEIAGHGLNHENAVTYIQQNGVDSYLKNEITPMMRLMRRNGLDVKNFAYPYGSRNTSADSALFKYFNVLRGTAYSSNVQDVAKLKCYYSFDDKKRLLFGLGIDEIYKNPVDYLKSVLKYAKENKKVVILYGHLPLPLAAPGKYQTSYSTVLEICKFVKDNNMKFYRMEDL